MTGRDREQHRNRVRKVLEALEKAGLRLKLEKCEFEREEVEFLGYRISGQGIKAAEEKLRVIKEWLTPTRKKELQAFLEFANFYRKFVKNFSKKAELLTKLIGKKE